MAGFARSNDDLRAILEVSVAENEGEGIVMTKGMLRRRVVTLYRAGDYKLALEVARLANASSTPNSSSHGEACGPSTEAADVSNVTDDPALTEVIALLEEKLALDEENDDDESSDDGNDDVDDDDDDDDDEEEEEDEEEESDGSDDEEEDL